MAGKRYYWLKLQVGFFQELIIKQLRTLPEGDSIVLLYLKLLLKAINTEGIIYYQHILPTLDEEIALDTGEKSALVKLTISALCQYHAAVFLDDQSLQLLYLEDMVGSESASAARVRNHRANQKLLMESFDEVTREVVKRLGFQNICLSENIVADRARFAEIYQAIQRRKRTEVNIGSALPNLREMVQNRLAELDQKEQKAIDSEKDKN